jgi:hypothetical protein
MIRPLRLHVNVTPADIADAIPMDGSHCPIAHAIQRRLPVGLTATIEPGRALAVIHDLRLHLGPRDRGQPQPVCEFRLTLPAVAYALQFDIVGIAAPARFTFEAKP